jgi:N-acetylmuramoyl-L-alanine amidase
MTTREKSPALPIFFGMSLLLAMTCLMWLWVSRKNQAIPGPDPSIPGSLELRDGVSLLAPTPRWEELENYQGTITRESFTTALEKVYSQGPAYKTSIKIEEDHALIRTAGEPYRLDFGSAPTSAAPERYWRAAVEMPIAESDRATRPLEGVRIALDAGHIGGEWAKMEERWYQIDGTGTEVKEGELTLQVAKILKPQLEQLGARVFLVRDDYQPVTDLRPSDLVELARADLVARNQAPDGAEARSEIMFYRWSEIRARAEKINREIRPDLTLCLHFNAESWGDPTNPQLSPRNHLHLLINGTYSNYEFSLHDQRLDLLQRLLQRIHPEELAVSLAVAESMADTTGLPAYAYTKPTARHVSDNRYLYARNLMANRIYYCPIVFLEPYVMNSREVYERVRAGDYLGKREVGGEMRKSILREYANGVTEGLANYYRGARPAKK